jgi:hypothetical protein
MDQVIYVNQVSTTVSNQFYDHAGSSITASSHGALLQRIAAFHQTRSVAEAAVPKIRSSNSQCGHTTLLPDTVLLLRVSLRHI